MVDVLNAQLSAYDRPSIWKKSDGPYLQKTCKKLQSNVYNDGNVISYKSFQVDKRRLTFIVANKYNFLVSKKWTVINGASFYCEWIMKLLLCSNIILVLLRIIFKIKSRLLLESLLKLYCVLRTFDQMNVIIRLFKWSWNYEILNCLGEHIIYSSSEYNILISIFVSAVITAI